MRCWPAQRNGRQPVKGAPMASMDSCIHALSATPERMAISIGDPDHRPRQHIRLLMTYVQRHKAPCIRNHIADSRVPQSDLGFNWGLVHDPAFRC